MIGGMAWIRVAGFVAVGVLMFLFGTLGNSVLRELRSLSTAEVDSVQWPIVQTETEIANLQVALNDAMLDQAALGDGADQTAVRLRADIALSRLGIAGRGRAAELLGNTPHIADALDRLSAYSDEIASILDADDTLSADELARMSVLTETIRPDVRQIVLAALHTGMRQDEAQRAHFSMLLTQTCAIAIALIAGLGALFLLSDRLVVRARRGDAALLTSNARLASTVAASLDAIVTANAAGVIVEFNASAERIFGWSRDEVIGKKMQHTIVPPRHREAHVAGMARYNANHESHLVDAGRFEMSAMRKSGEEFPVEMNITTVQSKGGELFIAYLRDISARKIAEQELIDARDRAESMDRAKSQFMTMMSHEMRTPLNGILGVLDLLRTTDLNLLQGRYVDLAAASGEILLEQINDALDVTRIETGSINLMSLPFDLHATVANVTDVLRPLAQEKDLDLALEFEAGMDHRFVGDGGRIWQILTNLIGNAIKFTSTGSIIVQVSGIHGADDTSVTIIVRDTGNGIPKERLDDIFEDFVVLSNAKGRQARGDGLGLSISRKIARLMGGDLTAHSMIGHGSTFVLNIPLARVATDRSQDSTDPEAMLETGGDGSKDVLIVEDNLDNRTVLGDMLEGIGHRVTKARDGLEGVNIAQEKPFDLIIMDISMPVLDGIDAVRRIRNTPGPNQNCQILGLTAHGREEYGDVAEEAGMDSLFTKPIRLGALIEVLEKVSEQAEVPSQTPAGPRKGRGVLDTEVLGELLEALGQDKMGEAIDRFFVHLSEAADRLENPDLAVSDIAAELHKLRGGAALLGLTGVVNQIDALTPEAIDADGVASLREAGHATRTALVFRHVRASRPSKNA